MASGCVICITVLNWFSLIFKMNERDKDKGSSTLETEKCYEICSDENVYFCGKDMEVM